MNRTEQATGRLGTDFGFSVGERQEEVETGELEGAGCVPEKLGVCLEM